MKKIKTLSVFLSALTAFSGLSIATASAAETEVKRFGIVDYPEDIFTKDLDEIMYGLTIQYPDGSTVVTSSETFDYANADDYCKTMGTGSFFAFEESSGGLDVSGYVYVSEKMYIDVSYWDEASEKYYSDRLELAYPDDYELPDVFYQDGCVYEKNDDNTLTLKATYEPNYTWDTNNEVIYEPLVIPESVFGMTVTAVADYAFIDSSHIEDIIIPETVETIGEKAFGYCGGSHIHEYSGVLSATPLGFEFVEAEDDEEFIFWANDRRIYDKEYAQYLIDNYLSDCTDLEVSYYTMTGTATKSQILPLIEKEKLYVDFRYSKEENTLSDYLYSAMKKADEDTLIPITINTTATGEISATKIRRALKSRYFDEDTEFYYDWYEHIYVEATVSQINALKDDEYVTRVELGDSEFISSELYYELYDADWEDTFNIYLNASGFENPEEYLRISHEAYFDNCKGDFVMIDGSVSYVIYGASKQQIIDTSCVDYLEMQLFDEPVISQYNGLVIYGEAGSSAEEYAKANGIKFAQERIENTAGDVNLDGIVTIVDVTLVMKANVGLVKLTEHQTKLADFNNDGIVNVVDATDIQKKLAGF